MGNLDKNKRWLVSKLKSSGSLRSNLYNGSYSEERNTKNATYKNLEELPKRESHKKTAKIIQGKINFGPLIRFIETQVGHDWNSVFAEINARIPTKLKYCIHIIDDTVAIKTELRAGYLYNIKTNRCIRDESSQHLLVWFDDCKYYVDYRTNILHKRL